MRLLLVCGLGCVFTALPVRSSELLDKPEGMGLQNAVIGVVRDVQLAVVYLSRSDVPGGCSGTIISADGLILTCAHIDAKAGDEIVVQTADGRQHRGEIIAKSTQEGAFGDDLALAQLVDTGPWPFVPLGAVGTITSQTPMLAFGYPATGLLTRSGVPPHCQVRIGYRLDSDHANKAGLIRTTIRGFAGDSGGPIVDLNGHLIGVTTNFESGGVCLTFNTVDLLRKRWNVLAGNRIVPPIPVQARADFPTLQAVFSSAVSEVQELVVEVRSDIRTVATGLIVARGRVLTKASALEPELTVALADETVSYARVLSVDHTHDLALLEMGTTAADDTPRSVDWSKSTNLERGQLVAIAAPAGFSSPTGLVAVGAVQVPPLEGSIPVLVENAQGGVKVTGIVNELFLPGLQRVFPLQIGDVITHVQDSPTPDLDGWVRRFEDWNPTGERPRIAGEPVDVRYLRAGVMKETTFPLALNHNPAQLIRASSGRATGFEKAVIAQFYRSRPEHCGAPVVDVGGRVVGIYIAKSQNVEDLVLPMDEVQEALRLLETSQDEK